MEHSSGVVASLRNASNYGILSLLLMTAKVENERMGREREQEDQCMELLYCTSIKLQVLPCWLKETGLSCQSCHYDPDIVMCKACIVKGTSTLFIW